MYSSIVSPLPRLPSSPPPPPPPPPPPLPPRTSIHKHREEPYPILRLSSTLLCSLLACNVLGRLSPYITLAEILHRWLTNHRSKWLWPLLQKQIKGLWTDPSASTINGNTNSFTSWMCYEFQIGMHDSAENWIYAFLKNREIKKPEPRRGITRTGMSLSRMPRSSDSEPPEAERIRKDLRFGLFSHAFYEDDDVFIWYRGALVKIEQGGRNLVVKVFGLSRSPFFHLLAEGKRLYSMNSKTDEVYIFCYNQGKRGLCVRFQKAVPLKSLIVPGATRSSLTHYLDDFRCSQTWYGNRGLIWRYGILIVGPPGCGKRTCLASIMQHLKWDCVAISLTGPCMDDQELQRILNRQNSSVGLVIWLQDFEAWHKQDLEASVKGDVESITGTAGEPTESSLKAHSSKPGNTSNDAIAEAMRTNGSATPAPAQGRRVTREGLQKVLECSLLPQSAGVVFIMTVKSLEGVDKSFLQPGKIDRVIHVSKATRGMAEQLFQQFYVKLPDDIKTEYDENKVAGWSKEWAGFIQDGVFSLADLKGMLLLHRFDPEEAVRSMPGWIASKTSSITTLD